MRTLPSVTARTAVALGAGLLAAGITFGAGAAGAAPIGRVTELPDITLVTIPPTTRTTRPPLDLCRLRPDLCKPPVDPCTGTVVAQDERDITARTLSTRPPTTRKPCPTTTRPTGTTPVDPPVRVRPTFTG